MTRLASSYAAIGRLPAALKLRQDVVAIHKAKFGPDHSETIQSMDLLADMYDDLGREQEALKIYEEVFTLRKAKLGPDHPETLNSMHGLANSYYYLDRHSEALTLREEALARMKSKLGLDHRSTLRAATNLAISYEHFDRHKEAVALLEPTLRLKREKLGPDNTSTLICMAHLASSYIALERGKEAIPLIDEFIGRTASNNILSGMNRSVFNDRLHYYASENDSTGCRTTAEMWDKRRRTDAASLYSAARMWSVTSGIQSKAPAADAARLAKADADKAMAWLTKAVAAGYKDRAHLEKDKDLDPLRTRDDFQKLLASLPAAPAKPPAEKKP